MSLSVWCLAGAACGSDGGGDGASDAGATCQVEVVDQTQLAGTWSVRTSNASALAGGIRARPSDGTSLLCFDLDVIRGGMAGTGCAGPDFFELNCSDLSGVMSQGDSLAAGWSVLTSTDLRLALTMTDAGASLSAVISGSDDCGISGCTFRLERSDTACAEGTESLDYYAVDASPYGRSLAEWAQLYWEWVLSMPFENNPYYGGDCDQNQSGDVWFLGVNGTGPAQVTCQLPANKAVMFPVLTGLCHACPEDLGAGECDYTTPEGLIECLGDTLDNPTFSVTLNGEDITDLVDRRAVTVAFEAQPPAEHSVLYNESSGSDCAQPWEPGNACNATGPRLVRSDGYWVMLEPLPVGRHIIDVQVSSPALTNQRLQLSVVAGEACPPGDSNEL